MADKTWKSIERKVAKAFGGERVPVTGRARGSAPDVRHWRYSFEIKHRKGLPSWLHEAMAQAVASKTRDKFPLVVLHERGQAIEQSYAVMRLGDFIANEEGIRKLNIPGGNLN